MALLDALSGRTVAVTGGSGFIGGRLLERLAGAECRIIRVSGKDRTSFSRLAEADVVFHLAAQTSAAVSAADPAADFASNVEPMHNLLAACRHRETRPVVIFAGTVTEAGAPRALPVNEDALDDPITVYDQHKLAAERALVIASDENIVTGVTLRLANVYGPGAASPPADRGVFNRMIRTAMDGGSVTVFGDGRAIRDYVFVDDVVDAFLAAAANAAAISGRYFVIGTGHGVSIRDAFQLIATRVEARFGRRVQLVTMAAPEGESAIERRDFVADSSRFMHATGWRPRWSLSDGIDRTIEAAVCA